MPLNSIKDYIDFDKVMNDLKEKRNLMYGKDSIQIKGGSLNNDNDLINFTKQLNELDYRIWLYTDKIIFDKNCGIDETRVFYFERGLLFNETNGSLEIRRDMYSFKWNFIGDKNFKLPVDFSSNDFFMQYSAEKFTVYEDKMLLWGSSKDVKGVRFWDDRVAKAELKYPIDNCKRAFLRYKRYVRNGNTDFVWYSGLEGKDE